MRRPWGSAAAVATLTFAGLLLSAGGAEVGAGGRRTPSVVLPGYVVHGNPVRRRYGRGVRLFVALVPPDEVVGDLAEFLAPRREVPEASGIRWTAPEQWHVTLAFMGDVAERHLDELVERLGRAASRRPALELTITGGGAFPNVARAKVLFAGLDAAGRDADLRHLAVGTRAAATKAGADAEGGRFRAHVTIARIGRPVDVTRWVRVLDTYRGPTWRAFEVSLVQSHLGEGPRRRPRYEVLETFSLGI